MQNYQMLIDGEWKNAMNGGTREAINPATGEPFAYVAWGNREDARAAIAAANEAQKLWARVPLWERCALVESVAPIIERRKEDLAEILCTELGKPRANDAVAEAMASAINFLIAPQQAKYLEGKTYPVQTPGMRVLSFRRPLGVISCITPWNFPAAIPTEYIPYALVMGNAVVWTPAPTAAATACVLADIIQEAGLPKGLLNLVIGPGDEVGDELVVHPRTHAIGMTGSPKTAKIISTRCGLKPRLFELGGNGPIVVLDDADPRKAARTIAPACFYNAGQVCSSGERIFVESKIKEEFIESLVEESRNWVTGDPRNANTTVGPLNNPAVLQKVEAHINDARQRGAKICIGGERPAGSGYFYSPTVLEGFTADSLINQEETFGPVAPVFSFERDSDAWAVISACKLGLVSSVFTQNLDRAWTWAENLRTGLTMVNEFTNYYEFHLPFGGRSGTDSSVGRIGGKETLKFMSEIQTIAFRVEERF